MTGPGLLTPRSGRVAGARRLSQRKYREREGRFLVEGPQAVREALGASRLVEVYASPAFAVRHPDDAAALTAAGVPVHACDDAALAALAGSVTPQGVVGVAVADTTTLDDVLSRRPRMLVVLHEVRDPGNAGAVVRVADAAGADAVLLSAASVDVGNDKVVRSSTGSVFHLPVVTAGESLATVTAVQRAGLRVLAADAAADAVDLDDVADAGGLAPRTAWLFGNEAWGLPPELAELADHRVRIPIHGRAESLNLSTAAALCLYASARVHRR